MQSRILALVLVPLAGRAAEALACASCVSSGVGDRTFNWAFVGLMAAPFVVAGVVGGVILHAYWRRHEPGR